MQQIVQLITDRRAENWEHFIENSRLETPSHVLPAPDDQVVDVTLICELSLPPTPSW
jgi:hypothetical protein